MFLCLHPVNGNIEFYAIVIIFSLIYILYLIFNYVAKKATERANRKQHTPLIECGEKSSFSESAGNGSKTTEETVLDNGATDSKTMNV